MTFQIALRYWIGRVKGLTCKQEKGETHVGLDVLVLKVEGVLPHVDTDDGDQMQ